MASINVQFSYRTGIKRTLFTRARLSISCDTDGRYSDNWRVIPMQPFTGEDGCPAWRASRNQ